MSETRTFDLASLMHTIDQAYPFNNQQYPGFEELSSERRGGFIIKHSVLHLSKSVGKLAREAEHQDHGEDMDNEVLCAATTNLVISVLNLAAKCGMTTEELVGRIQAVMNA